MFLAKFFFEFYAQVQKCHFDKNEKLPKWHLWSFAWISKFFWPKAFFWSIMKMAIRKNIHNLSQGPPNPGFMQKKVQIGDFLKKDSVELKIFVCFRFLWISQRPGTLNWERLFFWLSKNLHKQCVGEKAITRPLLVGFTIINNLLLHILDASFSDHCAETAQTWWWQ